MGRLGPRLTVRALRPLMSGLSALGHDPAPLLVEAGINPATLSDPDQVVPMEAVLGFLAVAVRVTGDDNLGLHLAEHADLGSGDVHFYAMLSSPTLGEAYQRVCRYQRLIHESSRVELDARGDRAVLRHRLAGGLPAPRQTAEFLLAIWVRGGRAATGQAWAPAEVRFAHQAPRDPAGHQRFFGAPVRFASAENALVLPAALLELPCERADPALLAVLDRYAAGRLERAGRGSSDADRVRTALVDLLRSGQSGAEQLATRLKMSRRTLHRVLAAEETSYRQLLDQVRRELATAHLVNDRVSIAEVAFLVGFADLSAFYRAFKRWTGQTPAAYRAASRTRGDDRDRP